MNSAWNSSKADRSLRIYVPHSLRAFLLIALAGLVVIPTPPRLLANGQILLVIDAASNRHPISPYIYGLNEALPSTMRELNTKVNRWGGNRATRYNWKKDTTSTAADWYFQNLKSGPDRSEDEWKYKDYELFIRGNQQNGSDSLITIPMIGWVAKDDESKSFSVAKYGPQHSVSPEHKDAGDGIKPDGSFVVNDPNDANESAGVDFQRDWVKQIVKTFGPAKSGGVRFYSLDNEPSLWHEIHRDLHPKPASYDEILGLSKQYAEMIKSVDSDAAITGPVLSHWSSFFNSAADNFEEVPTEKPTTAHLSLNGICSKCVRPKSKQVIVYWITSMFISILRLAPEKIDRELFWTAKMKAVPICRPLGCG